MLTKKERSKLRGVVAQSEFKSELAEMHGVKCSNCRTEENIEWHHIVPLACGGTNNKENIVPLCHKCHMLAHHGMQDLQYSNEINRGGRPSKTDSDPEICKYLDMYIYGKIGKAECAELTGYSKGSLGGGSKTLKKYLKSKGISEFRNMVDVIGTNSYLYRGRQVGYVVFEDGHKELTFYTGGEDDDKKYKKREFSTSCKNQPEETVHRNITHSPVKRNDLIIDFQKANMNYLDDYKSKIYDMYAVGHIGAYGLSQRFGCTQAIALTCSAFEEYCKKNHITRIINEFDLLKANNDLKPNLTIGYVLYDDGMRKPIIYIDDRSSEFAV